MHSGVLEDMKQSLQLKLGQHLTMTPQLQQAIRLLQLSTLDLQQEIQEVLDSNMMLEVNEDDGINEESPASNEVLNAESLNGSETVSSEEREVPDSDAQAEIPDELPVDTSWEDVYDSVQTATSTLPVSDQQDIDFQRPASETLRDHLFWQMELATFSEQDRAIASAIIDAINDHGYLSMPIEEIHEGLLTQLQELELDEVDAVLHQIQNFDPAGIGAVDLADCLTIQLRQLPADTPWREVAIILVQDYLDYLAAQNQVQLKRVLDLPDEELSQVVSLIRSLNPRPGSCIETGDSQYVIPDVFVTKKKGAWQVNLNPDIAPKLRVNPFYSGMIRRADNSADNTSMKNHLQEAKWFLKSLHSRSETLLKVAKCIVDHQRDFLDHGPIAMKPLVLREIAELVDMHESTVSRVTTQKYMHTASGIFEFKYFFSSHVTTDSGGECSSTAIRAFIKELIASENRAKPLSDSKISALLKDKGINVARRTIAKYRELMSVPPSNQRKRIL